MRKRDEGDHERPFGSTWVAVEHDNNNVKPSHPLASPLLFSSLHSNCQAQHHTRACFCRRGGTCVRTIRRGCERFAPCTASPRPPRTHQRRGDDAVLGRERDQIDVVRSQPDERIADRDLRHASSRLLQSKASGRTSRRTTHWLRPHGPQAAKPGACRPCCSTTRTHCTHIVHTLYTHCTHIVRRPTSHWAWTPCIVRRLYRDLRGQLGAENMM